MRILVAFFVAALTLSTPALAGPAQTAQAATKAWLGLIDHDHYAQSWTSASPLFRGRITERKWARTAASVRDPLGAVEARKAGAVKLTDSLPGAPDGYYAVIRFRTPSAHKKNATDTVVMTDDHGTWQSSGYFIR